MKRFILAVLAVSFAWLGLAAVPAAAQNIYPYQQPRFGPGWQTPLSPYLNLLLPGNTAVNYYALTEPQFQRRQYRNQTNLTLQGMLNQLPQPPGIPPEEDLNAPMPATGHPTAVNFTGSYFSTLTGQPFASEGAFAQRARSASSSSLMMRRQGMRGGGAAMMGAMRGGMGMGTAGTWPNMRPGMGMGR